MPRQNILSIMIFVSLGAIVGLGAYTIWISKATSYLSDRPEACLNCHVMGPQYANWLKSSHHNVATCNDCHVPHDNFLHKYSFKAMDGLYHSTIFTLGLEPQVIKARPASSAVIEENCKRCHSDFILRTSLSDSMGPHPHQEDPAQAAIYKSSSTTTAATAAATTPGGAAAQATHQIVGSLLTGSGEHRPCWSCHREVPHGRIKSLSSVPFTQAPFIEAVFSEKGEGTPKVKGATNK